MDFTNRPAKCYVMVSEAGMKGFDNVATGSIYRRVQQQGKVIKRNNKFIPF
jgi:hypothetical protein